MERVKSQVLGPCRLVGGFFADLLPFIETVSNHPRPASLEASECIHRLCRFVSLSRGAWSLRVSFARVHVYRQPYDPSGPRNVLENLSATCAQGVSAEPRGLVECSLALVNSYPYRNH